MTTFIQNSNLNQFCTALKHNESCGGASCIPYCFVKNPYVYIDRDLRILSSNKLAMELLGIQDTNSDFLSYFDDVLKEEYKSIVDRCFLASGQYSLAFKLRNDDLLNLVAEYDESTNSNRLLIVFVSNISRELEAIHSAARSSSLFVQLLDSFPGMAWGYYQTDTEFSIEAWSASLSSLKERPSEDVLPSDVFFADHQFRALSRTVFSILNNPKVNKTQSVPIYNTEVSFVDNKATCTYFFDQETYKVTFMSLIDPSGKNLKIESFVNVTEEYLKDQKLKHSMENYSDFIRVFPFICYAVPVEEEGVVIRGLEAQNYHNEYKIDYDTFLTPAIERLLKAKKQYYPKKPVAVTVERNGRKKKLYFDVTFSTKQLGSSYFYLITAANRTDDVIERDKLRKKEGDLSHQLSQKSLEVVSKDLFIMEQAKLALLGEMVESIAHQWRQPLNMLSVKISKLVVSLQDEESIVTGDDIVAFCEDSLSVLQMMSSTITDFQNFTRHNRDVSKFGVLDAIKDARFLIDPSLNFHHIDLTIDGDSDIVLEGVKSELTHVFLNLFSNSRDQIIKRLEANHFNPWIRVTCIKDESSYRIVVADNGGGIPKEGLPTKIFEPRVTFKANGTGIGLYMTKNILNSSFGGTISASNDLDSAIFEIVIPN